MGENKDVAIIDIEKYNSLRDFKDNILKGKFYQVTNRYRKDEYYTLNERDEVIRKFEDANKALVEENNKLREQINDLSSTFSDRVKEEKNSIFEMFAGYSIFGFRKWKKKYLLWKK